MTEDVISHPIPSAVVNENEEVKKDHESVSVVSQCLVNVFQSNQRDLNVAVRTAALNPWVQQTISKLKKFTGRNVLVDKDLQILNKRFMSGHLPRSKPVPDCQDGDDSDDDDDDNEDELKPDSENKQQAVPFLSRILQFQIYLVLTVRDYAMKYASKFGQTWLRSMIPTRQITTLISFLLYTYVLNAEFLIFAVPLLTLLISLLSMVVSTIRSVRGERRFKEFLAWSELLESVGTALNVEEAEDNYFKNHLSPIISLPIALILSVMSFSVCSKDVLPTSEMALFSLGLAFTCFVSFYEAFTTKALLSIFALVAATAIEGFNLLSGDSLLGFSFGTWNTLQFNLTLSVAFRFISYALAASLPFDEKYRTKFVGILRGLVPCLYVLLWWKMFSLFFQHSSAVGLIRASIGVIALFMSIPASMMLFCFAVGKWFTSIQFIQILFSVLLLVVPLMYFKISQRGYSFVSKVNFSGLGPSLRILGITFLVILAFAVVALYRPAGLQIYNSKLKWHDYHNLCRPQFGKWGVLSKRLCHQLKGHHVSWIGVVNDIKITSIDNKFESVVNVLPSSLANWMTCAYGERYPVGEGECASSKNNSLLCSVGKRSQRECHLDAYNKYEFSINLQQNSDNDETGKITLTVDNLLKECVFQLHANMKLHFLGVLNPDSGTVSADNIKVLGSNTHVKCSMNVYLDVSKLLTESLKSVVRFIFSPFVTFSKTYCHDD